MKAITPAISTVSPTVPWTSGAPPTVGGDRYKITQQEERLYVSFLLSIPRKI